MCCLPGKAPTCRHDERCERGVLNLSDSLDVGPLFLHLVFPVGFLDGGVNSSAARLRNRTTPALPGYATGQLQRCPVTQPDNSSATRLRNRTTPALPGYATGQLQRCPVTHRDNSSAARLRIGTTPALTIMNGNIMYNKAHNNVKYKNKKQKRIKLKTIIQDDSKNTIEVQLRIGTGHIYPSAMSQQLEGGIVGGTRW